MLPCTKVWQDPPPPPQYIQLHYTVSTCQPSTLVLVCWDTKCALQMVHKMPDPQTLHGKTNPLCETFWITFCMVIMYQHQVYNGSEQVNISKPYEVVWNLRIWTLTLTATKHLHSSVCMVMIHLHTKSGVNRFNNSENTGQTVITVNSEDSNPVILTSKTANQSCSQNTMVNICQHSKSGSKQSGSENTMNTKHLTCQWP